MNEIKEYTEKVFEDIKHIDENKSEYWYARELMPLLEYSLWQRFSNVLRKAMDNCLNSNNNVLDHFISADKMVSIGSNTERKIQDYKLSRYACYLIVLNCDPRKKVIALAKTYFAIQTRKQELSEKEYNELSEYEKRLYRRNQVRKGNYNLNKTAVNSGVKDLARFHNAGYKGLYNGETADDIFKRKKLRYREDILDNMGSEELADNIFRIAQTDAKLKRDNVDNEYTANSVHYEVGKKVRNTIKELGGIMPEDLPTPKTSLKELEKETKRIDKICDIMIIGCDNMSYEEAKVFYGEEICNLLIKIYNFCKQSGYVIYQHATDLDSANNIMRKGFICSTSKIASIPREILENEPSDYTYDDDGIKTSIYDGGQCQFRQSGIRDEFSDTQHFFENTHCNLDFGSLTNPDINRSGFGATCIFVVSKDFHGSREYKQFGIVESHFDDWEDQQVPETYFERHIIPKQFCIGYLDVNNKRFVANPSFQFNYGINDEFSLGTTTATERDLSIELENNIRRSK